MERNGKKQKNKKTKQKKKKAKAIQTDKHFVVLRIARRFIIW